MEGLTRKYREFHREGGNNRDFLIKFHLNKGRGGYIFSLFNFVRLRLFCTSFRLREER